MQSFGALASRIPNFIIQFLTGQFTLEHLLIFLRFYYLNFE